MVFTDQEKINSFLENYKEGQEITESKRTEQHANDDVKMLVSPCSPLRVNAGDEASPLALDVLNDAGITTPQHDRLSEEVLTSIGQDRINELRQIFGENWAVAGAFEYCWLNLPHSSAAFVAASYRFHYYITGDDFSAGYHWRDLEVLIERVEETAQKTFERSKKAGQSGSQKSRQARDLRRSRIMDALEIVCQRNPDIVKLAPNQITTLALDEAIKKDAALWSQGQGQVQEYLDEIRRGEAGEDLKSRFVALLGSKPPKRLRRK